MCLPLLKQKLLGQRNLCCGFPLMNDVILSSLRHPKVRKSSWNAQVLPLLLSNMALISVLTRVVVFKTMGMILRSEGIRWHHNFLLGPLLSMLFADIFVLCNGGKPHVEITLEIIEFTIGITCTLNLAWAVLSSLIFSNAVRKKETKVQL